MSTFDPTRYPAVLATLLNREEELDLGPGSADNKMRADLRGLEHAEPFAPHEVADRGMASLCISGLWLMHNYLDESHTLSQKVDTPTGSYWHGIMHRREGDYSNAQYWFRRVGDHPVFEPLAAAARELAAQWPVPDGSSEFFHEQTEWDPFAFIDLCEATTRGRSEGERLCRRINRIEWELLFDFCYREAVGESAVMGNH